MLFLKLNDNYIMQLNKFLFFHSKIYRCFVVGSFDGVSPLPLQYRVLFRTVFLMRPKPSMEIKIPASWGVIGRDMCTFLRLNSEI